MLVKTIEQNMQPNGINLNLQSIVFCVDLTVDYFAQWDDDAQKQWQVFSLPGQLLDCNKILYWKPLYKFIEGHTCLSICLWCSISTQCVGQVFLKIRYGRLNI